MEPDGHSDELIMQQQRQIEKEVLNVYYARLFAIHIEILVLCANYKKIFILVISGFNIRFIILDL